MTFNELSIDDLERIDCLKEQGFTAGLARALLMHGKESFPLRIWIVDNSGSMRYPDGKRLIETKHKHDVQWRSCTRWAELAECVRYHAQLAALLEAPTKFIMLNALPSHDEDTHVSMGVAEMGPDMVDQELHSLFHTLERVNPGGVTPLMRHVQAISATIQTMAPSLRREGKQVAVVLATDGIPTDKYGGSGRSVRNAFAEAIRELIQDLPVWMVVRLCTNEQDVVDYYSQELDANLELNLEVLDDFESEAKEVQSKNPWLTYGLALHRCREMGFRHCCLDLMDERRLTLEEALDFLRLLLGDDAVSTDPLVDGWDVFSEELQEALAKEEPQWNPITKRVVPWIDAKRLQRTYQPTRGNWFLWLLLLFVMILFGFYQLD